MGIDDLLEDDIKIQQELEKLEKALDFVIILEYYVESMILLAAHLDIPLEYMFVSSHKIAEEYPKPALTPDQRATFEKHFKIDIMMYRLFNETFHNKIATFGHEKYFFHY